MIIRVFHVDTVFGRCRAAWTGGSGIFFLEGRGGGRGRGAVHGELWYLEHVALHEETRGAVLDWGESGLCVFGCLGCGVGGGGARGVWRGGGCACEVHLAAEVCISSNKELCHGKERRELT